MQLSSIVFSLLVVAQVALSAPRATTINLGRLVESNKLRRLITRTALLKHSRKLQEFSDASVDQNRAFGGVGHKMTVDYLYDLFRGMSDYYTVEKQEFVHEYAYGTSHVVVEGESYDSSYFTYAPSTNGPLTLELANTNGLGCNATDYPASVAGKIALISRGTCEFGLKSVLAGKAGAKAVLIYNNVNGTVAGGTYGPPVRALGPYVPGVMISLEAGQRLKADVAAGPVLATLTIDALVENRTTHNVIAQTKGGDQNNVIVTGGHSDSVGAGPGINDDGSGAIGILEVATRLTRFSVNNAVRFCFWSAEEFGLVGSEYYINNLAPTELNKIALYLNFDMIASPNFVYFVYDGDGSAFNVSGPQGSGHIQAMFVDHFKRDVGYDTKPTGFDGRSDYGPFLQVGIPSGGLFTGAEGEKTVEEAKYYGGKAGEWYDPNYHKKGDTIKNLDMRAFVTNTKAIAHAIAKYARSTEGIPKREPAKVKRELLPYQRTHNHGSACGHIIETM